MLADRVNRNRRDLVGNAAAEKFVGDKIGAEADRSIDDKVFEPGRHRVACECFHGETLGEKRSSTKYRERILQNAIAFPLQQPLERIPGIVGRKLRHEIHRAIEQPLLFLPRRGRRQPTHVHMRASLAPNAVEAEKPAYLAESIAAKLTNSGSGMVHQETTYKIMAIADSGCLLVT